MDILQEKWYGGLPCFKLVTEIAQPRPLGVTAVTGVFILLGVGIFLGFLILLVEHLFYRYTLPILRHKPKGTIWRSRNIMFFSQVSFHFSAASFVFNALLRPHQCDCSFCRSCIGSSTVSSWCRRIMPQGNLYTH